MLKNRRRGCIPKMVIGKALVLLLKEDKYLAFFFSYYGLSTEGKDFEYALIKTPWNCGIAHLRVKAK